MTKFLVILLILEFEPTKANLYFLKIAIYKVHTILIQYC